MSRICLLTQSHLTTNPRLVKEADALVADGHDVDVVAADFSPWARATDADFASRAWRVTKLTFGPDAPRARRCAQVVRQRSAKALARLGIRHPAIVRAAWHPIAAELVAVARGICAELYIAHYPAALPAAAIAAFHNNAIYAYDAEDFHLGDPPESGEYETERELVRAIEGRYLPGCRYVSAAAPGIAEAYVQAYGIAAPQVVLNVFPRANAPDAPTPRGEARPAPSVYWFSQTIGPDRGLECAVAAIAHARSKPHLYLRGAPAAGFEERLRSLAAAAAVGDRLHILPPAAPSQMERLAASYDVGLVGETGHTPNRRIALTNKQFSYMLAGIPAVLSDIPAHRLFAADAASAVRLYRTEDAGSLANVLDDLLCDDAALARARRAAFELGQSRYNWDVEQAALLRQVRQALEGSRSALPVTGRH